MRRSSAVPVLAGALVALGGCGDQQPTAPGIEAKVIPMCQLGCYEEDPDPEAPGYFLTSVVQPDYCFHGSYNDVDQDGLGDLCEERLAAAFAPQLAYSRTDNVSREPYWAAHRVDGPRVQIMYLLAYHLDLGVDNLACRLVPELCAGHYGDSEYLVLDVYYDEETHHWLLATAHYSAHGNVNTYDKGTYAYPQALTYPDKLGGYPRAWVSYNKHANYASAAECQEGGFLGIDDCLPPPQYARVPAPYYWNIGSSQHHFINCVDSRDPIYQGFDHQECLWTSLRFSGWIGLEPDCTGYFVWLYQWEF
jgi:hypothetical protein